jgi:hypothetical protein
VANVVGKSLSKTAALLSFLLCLLLANASFTTPEVTKESQKHSVISTPKNQISSVILESSGHEELFNGCETKPKKGRAHRGKWQSSFPDFGSDDLARELNAGFPKPLCNKAITDNAKQIFGKLHYCEEILSSRCHPPTK